MYRNQEPLVAILKYILSIFDFKVFYFKKQFVSALVLYYIYFV